MPRRKKIRSNNVTDRRTIGMTEIECLTESPGSGEVVIIEPDDDEPKGCKRKLLFHKKQKNASERKDASGEWPLFPRFADEETSTPLTHVGTLEPESELTIAEEPTQTCNRTDSHDDNVLDDIEDLSSDTESYRDLLRKDKKPFAVRRKISRRAMVHLDVQVPCVLSNGSGSSVETALNERTDIHKDVVTSEKRNYSDSECCERVLETTNTKDISVDIESCQSLSLNRTTKFYDMVTSWNEHHESINELSPEILLSPVLSDATDEGIVPSDDVLSTEFPKRSLENQFEDLQVNNDELTELSLAEGCLGMTSVRSISPLPDRNMSSNVLSVLECESAFSKHKIHSEENCEESNNSSTNFSRFRIGLQQENQQVSRDTEVSCVAIPQTNFTHIEGCSSPYLTKTTAKFLDVSAACSEFLTPNNFISLCEFPVSQVLSDESESSDDEVVVNENSQTQKNTCDRTNNLKSQEEVADTSTENSESSEHGVNGCISPSPMKQNTTRFMNTSRIVCKFGDDEQIVISSPRTPSPKDAGKRGSEWVQEISKNLKTPYKKHDTNMKDTPSVPDSSKKRLKATTGGLAEQLQRLRAREKSLHNIWLHEKLHRTSDDAIKSNLLQLKIVNISEEAGLVIAKCDVSSDGMDEAKNQHGLDKCFVIFQEHVFRKFGLEIDSLFVLHSPWHMLSSQETLPNPVILCPYYVKLFRKS